MKISMLKATIAVVVTTLVGYSPVWAQIINDCPDCSGGGGGDPRLAAPAVIALIAAGVVAAIVMAKRK